MIPLTRQDILEIRLAERGFCSDMQPLLRRSLTYDPQAAGRHVRDRVLMLLPQ